MVSKAIKFLCRCRECRTRWKNDDDRLCSFPDLKQHSKHRLSITKLHRLGWANDSCRKKLPTGKMRCLNILVRHPPSLGEVVADHGLWRFAWQAGSRNKRIDKNTWGQDWSIYFAMAMSPSKPWLAKCWFKENLRYQSRKVVPVDTYLTWSTSIPGSSSYFRKHCSVRPTRSKCGNWV